MHTHTHTHSWTSASLRMMCTLRRLLKSLVFWVFLGCRLMSPILLSRSHRLTVQHKLAAQTLQYMYWDADRTGSDRDLSHTHEHSTQTCACGTRCHVPRCVHDCFQERWCHFHVCPKEGTACITSLASPPAMRCQALRIKTGSRVQIRTACHDSPLWEETAPMLGDRGGQQSQCRLIPRRNLRLKMVGALPLGETR